MFRCPVCQEDNLRITALVRTTIDVCADESVDDYESGDLEWSDTDQAECLNCDWSGTVLEMTVAEPEEEEEIEKVFCALCEQEAPGDTAHYHQDQWIGECCWDDRLKASE
ncbi:MAG: hypothetical protein ABT940_08395 [Alphaproteobacteria bacterium]